MRIASLPRSSARLAGAFWIATGAAAGAPVADPAAAEVADLVARLGAEEFAAREDAAARLAELGSAATDALLAAAEVSDDLEVVLRARALAAALPLVREHDPPAAAALLERFDRGDADERRRVLQRLLRLEDDAGIEPLARLARLDRDQECSRLAAGLLASEWHPGDPAWQGMTDRIRAGLGAGARPAVRFLRAVVDGSCATDPDEAKRQAAAADAALAALFRDSGEDTDALRRRLGRVVIRMHLAAGDRDAALAGMHRILTGSRGTGGLDDPTADELAWASDHGLPEAVDVVEPWLAANANPSQLLRYAAALAWRRRPVPDAEARAAALAEAAFAAPTDATDFLECFRSAILLTSWGAPDWAAREYRRLAEDPRVPAQVAIQAANVGGEFFHEQGRHEEAAALLGTMLDGPRDNAIAVDEWLMRMERDPRAVRSRRLYFAAAAAAARGEAAEQWRLLEESLQTNGKDVDTLIALYRLSADRPERRAAVTARIRQALAAIDAEIQALPEESNGYNEYAWLVANTEGDLGKATRYSKRSLDRPESFDAPSYLDTLAHCRAAAGDVAGAVRTQLIAVRQDPHGVTLRRNLERFQSMLRAP